MYGVSFIVRTQTRRPLVVAGSIVLVTEEAVRDESAFGSPERRWVATNPAAGSTFAAPIGAQLEHRMYKIDTGQSVLLIQ